MGAFEIVIDDDTPESVYVDESKKRGLDLRSRPRSAYGYGASANPFPKELLIPKGEWQARIKEMEETETRISDLLKLYGVPPKNQQQTNYCWCFGPTRAFEITRLIQGQDYVSLSPASVGGPVTGFKNVGGWGKAALDYMIENGLIPTSKWPDTVYNGKQYNTAANKAEAKAKYRPTEWWELEARNVDELISCVLRRIPVAVGYDWWSHEVCAVDAVWQNGAIGLRIENSWGDWGDNGFGVLAGNKLPADDAVAPRVALAS